MKQALINKVKKLAKARGYTIQSCEVTKNNGYTDTHIRICDVSVSPSIPLEPHVNELLKGRSLEEVATHIVELLEEHKDVTFDISELCNVNYIEENVFFHIVNYEMNRSMIEQDNLIYQVHGDFAKILRVCVNIPPNSGTYLLSHRHLPENYNIARLWDIAEHNTVNMRPVLFMSIADVIEQMLDEPIPLPEDNPPLYVLTNSDKEYGASVIFYPDMLEQICDRLDVDEFIIIPSSIHEVLIAPILPNTSIPLNDMICEINDMQLAPFEVLGTRYYTYSRVNNIM